jgi:hypothetical protein
MKKILLSIAATAALTAAVAPAAAQPYGRHGGYSSNLSTSYVDSLDWKITNAAQERRISWGEARNLKSELSQVKPIAWRVQTGEARGWERQRLEQAVSRIEQAVNSGYDRGYGRGDGRQYGSGYGRGWNR